MNKQTSTITQRRLFALLAAVGVVLGLGVSAFLASINASDKSIAADAPRQTIEVKTPDQVTTATQAPTADAITPAPTQESDGATAKVSTPKTTKVNQTVVDSSTRVTVTPKPVATPTNSPAPQVSEEPKVSKPGPTEGFIRPQLTFIGATSCTASSDGWLVTLSWKLTGGNYIGQWFYENSGLKGTGDSWVITDRHEIVGSSNTGTVSFLTEGDSISFLAMNGGREIIDELSLPKRTQADLTGLCR